MKSNSWRAGQAAAVEEVREQAAAVVEAQAVEWVAECRVLRLEAAEVVQAILLPEHMLLQVRAERAGDRVPVARDVPRLVQGLVPDQGWAPLGDQDQALVRLDARAQVLVELTK